jgi:hypothetical protein
MGPGVMDAIPVATTASLFGERSLKACLIAEKFKEFNQALASEGFKPKNRQAIVAANMAHSSIEMRDAF